MSYHVSLVMFAQPVDSGLECPWPARAGNLDNSLAANIGIHGNTHLQA